VRILPTCCFSFFGFAAIPAARSGGNSGLPVGAGAGAIDSQVATNLWVRVADAISSFPACDGSLFRTCAAQCRRVGFLGTLVLARFFKKRIQIWGGAILVALTLFLRVAVHDDEIFRSAGRHSWGEQLQRTDWKDGDFAAGAVALAGLAGPDREAGTDAARGGRAADCGTQGRWLRRSRASHKPEKEQPKGIKLQNLSDIFQETGSPRRKKDDEEDSRHKAPIMVLNKEKAAPEKKGDPKIAKGNANYKLAVDQFAARGARGKPQAGRKTN